MFRTLMDTTNAAGYIFAGGRRRDGPPRAAAVAAEQEPKVRFISFPLTSCRIVLSPRAGSRAAAGPFRPTRSFSRA